MAVARLNSRVVIGLISACIGLAGCNNYRISNPASDVQIRMLDRNGNSSNGRSIPSANRSFLERQRKLAEASAEARSVDRPLILDNSVADVGIVQHVPTVDATEADTRVGKISPTPTEAKVAYGDLHNNETESMPAAAVEPQNPISASPERRLITANKVSYQDIFADVQNTANVPSSSNEEELITIVYPEDNSTIQKTTATTVKTSSSPNLKLTKGTQATFDPVVAQQLNNAKTTTNKRAVSAANRHYFIQGGSYKNSDSAERQAKSYRKIGYPVEIRSNHAKPELYRVMIGPFETRATADKAMEKVIEYGFFDVFVKTE